jgi:hypothetical protein
MKVVEILASNRLLGCLLINHLCVRCTDAYAESESLLWYLREGTCVGLLIDIADVSDVGWEYSRRTQRMDDVQPVI